jgi:uncharacterized repeat protein (TIGR01451 family)
MRSASVTTGAAVFTVVGALGLSCGPQDAPQLPGPQEKAVASKPLLGADKAATITKANTIINTYTALTADAKVGDASVTVKDAGSTGLNLNPGDLIMVIQPQGATMDRTDTAPVAAGGYGYVSAANLGSAGKYEIAAVKSIDTTTAGKHVITLDYCAGLKNAYATAGHAQVVRVPQYTTLDVAAGASITAAPWDGEKGGVVAAYVQGRTGLLGNIDASGTGFRGGATDDTSQTPGATLTTKYRSKTAADGAEHGEGIAGSGSTTLGSNEYDNLYSGKYQRGAAANGGGGGNSHNGGGGGGANQTNGRDWTGCGVMTAPAGTVFAQAWALDNECYKTKHGNALANSSGGGRGGYTYGSTVNDPTKVAPGNSAWGGDSRQESGGLGGRPLVNSPKDRLFFGGGGGAGDGNNGSAGAGGRGGGVVFLVTGALEGTGSILSKGGAGSDTKVGTSGNDAPGGGGAGGSIVVLAGRAINLTGTASLIADGGAGGKQNITLAAESEGPGGGGGGGYVCAFSPQPLQLGVLASAAGGASGTSNSTAVLTFNVNGATDGAPGKADDSLAYADAPAMPVCVPSDLQTTATLTQGTVAVGNTVQMQVTIKNSGPQPSNHTRITDNITGGVGPIAWTCTAAGGAVCPAAAGVGSIQGIADIPAQGSLTYSLVVGPIAAEFTGPLSYTVDAAVPPGFNDLNTGNNSATVDAGGGTNLPSADISVGINSTPNPQLVPGDPISYDIRVQNSGPSSATGAAVSFSVPAGSVIQSFDNSASGWNCKSLATTVVCVYGQSVPQGALPNVKITVVPPSGASSISATAQASSQGVVDPNTANNSATEVTPIGSAPSADLVLTITASPNPPQSGQPITYTLDVANKGPDAATGAVLTYDIPQTGTVQSITAPFGWNCATQPSGANPTQVSCWYSGNIEPGTSAPDVQIVVVPGAGASSIVSSGTVTPKGAVDPNPDSNSTTSTLSLGKLSGGGFAFGCSAAPGSQASDIGGLLGTLLGLVGLRRRRRS